MNTRLRLLARPLITPDNSHKGNSTGCSWNGLGMGAVSVGAASQNRTLAVSEWSGQIGRVSVVDDLELIGKEFYTLQLVCSASFGAATNLVSRLWHTPCFWVETSRFASPGSRRTAHQTTGTGIVGGMRVPPAESRAPLLFCPHSHCKRRIYPNSGIEHLSAQALRYHACAPHAEKHTMIRSALALITLALLGTVATAQPRAVPVPVRVPQPLPLPLSPGVMPGSTIGPGMQYVPQRTTTFPRRYNTVVVPTIMPWGWGMGWGVPAYSPLVGGFGYPYGYGGYFPPAQNITVQQQVTNVGGGAQREQTIALAREYPATLTVQFPADAEVWLDGKKVSDGAGEVHVLKSPVLEQGDQYTFQVKGQWKSKGKTYEAKRSVTLGAGAKSRLLIVSGEEVKE